MKFVGTSLQGAWIIECGASSDDRGSFVRTFCAREFRDRGLEWRMTQSSISKSLNRHTLRGLHWQAGKHAEAKLVQCLRGQMLDVIVDLRAGSPTFGQHEKVVLSSDSNRMLYVPRGFAHGVLTLEDDTWVAYQMSNTYSKSAVRGVRFDDPRLTIAWPAEPRVISDQDRRWPALDSALVIAEGAS